MTAARWYVLLRCGHWFCDVKPEAPAAGAGDLLPCADCLRVHRTEPVQIVAVLQAPAR